MNIDYSPAVGSGLSGSKLYSSGSGLTAGSSNGGEELVTMSVDAANTLHGFGVGNNGNIIKYVYQKPSNVPPEPGKISSFYLSQNYPNPFNPATTINYQIPELNFVTIKIYDVLGKEAATLVNEEKPAGNYQIEFNGANLPSGIYFYRIQAYDYVETRKMVLLK